MKNPLDSKIISSSHISFLFGAGINGKAFPQLNGFVKTISRIEELLKRPCDSLESDINELNKNEQKSVYSTFRKEFSEHNKSINRDHTDIKDIEYMFSILNRLIVDSENRTVSMKQINVYTFNYDDIVDESLKKVGLLSNVISSSNIDNHSKFFDLIGFNHLKNRYIPTFLVSKLHGDSNNPILPGSDKYDETLKAKQFEILFKMKSQLSRMNSVLFVIGYAGRDEHINRLLTDCISSGLTIYWFKYVSKDIVPDDLSPATTVIDCEKDFPNTNPSRACGNMLEGLWVDKSEE